MSECPSANCKAVAEKAAREIFDLRCALQDKSVWAKQMRESYETELATLKAQFSEEREKWQAEIVNAYAHALEKLSSLAPAKPTEPCLKCNSAQEYLGECPHEPARSEPETAAFTKAADAWDATQKHGPSCPNNANCSAHHADCPRKP